MAACCAVGCKNKATKDRIRVFRFPAGTRHGNEERRRQWITNINRDNWLPSKGSYICEVHFDNDQWEPHRIGKRKLKWNAVPTLFPNAATVSRKKRTKISEDIAVNDKYKLKKTASDGDAIERLKETWLQDSLDASMSITSDNKTVNIEQLLRTENHLLKAELAALETKFTSQTEELQMTKARLINLEKSMEFLSKEEELLSFIIIQRE